MASEETWKKCRYFKAWENWGDSRAISDDLILRLDDFRHYIKCSIFVTSGVEPGGHAKKSFHYRENGACAVDIVIPEYPKGPIDLILDASRFGFTGIGYYPHWQYEGKVCGGIHLDTRPLKWEADETLNYAHSRWMGVLQENSQTGRKEQVYIPMTFENIIKFGGSYALENVRP